MFGGKFYALVGPGACKAEDRRLLMGKNERDHPAARDTVGVEHHDRTIGFHAYRCSGSVLAPNPGPASRCLHDKRRYAPR